MRRTAAEAIHAGASIPKWRRRGAELSSPFMTSVLLVTDAEWVRNDVSASLAVGKWDVVETDEPSAVLELARESAFDVIIVDMQVGSMGGMAVIRAITGEMEPDQRPRTALLLDRRADEFLARRAGADAWVVKPFTAQDLRAALETLGVVGEVTGGGPRKSRPRK
jgi:DNA-binding response OmpR family regulator